MQFLYTGTFTFKLRGDDKASLFMSDAGTLTNLQYPTSYQAFLDDSTVEFTQPTSNDWKYSAEPKDFNAGDVVYTEIWFNQGYGGSWLNFDIECAGTGCGTKPYIQEFTESNNIQATYYDLACSTTDLNDPKLPLTPSGCSAPYNTELLSSVNLLARMPLDGINVGNSGHSTYVGAIVEGWLHLKLSGTYEFRLSSDDGSQLYLSEKVINNYNNADDALKIDNCSGSLNRCAQAEDISNPTASWDTTSTSSMVFVGVQYVQLKWDAHLSLVINYIGDTTNPTQFQMYEWVDKSKFGSLLRSYEWPKGVKSLDALDALDETVTSLPRTGPAAIVPLPDEDWELGLIGYSEKDDYIALVYEGYMYFPEAGEYIFYLKSDDGSRLYINDNLVVNGK